MFTRSVVVHLLLGVTELNPENLLLVFAEVSVAYVGFGAIVAALQSRTDSWSIENRFLFRAIVESAFGSLLVAVIPLLVSGFGYTEGALWAYSSSLVALGAVCALIFRVFQLRLAFNKQPRVLRYIAWPPTLFSLGCFVGNAFYWQAAGPYILANATMILQASVMFLVLLYRIFPIGNKESHV